MGKGVCLKRSELEGLLLNKNAFSLLEDVLKRDNELEDEIRYKYSDYGKFVSKARLKELLKEVKPEVDDFLGISDMPTPSIVTSNCNALLLPLLRLPTLPLAFYGGAHFFGGGLGLLLVKGDILSDFASVGLGLTALIGAGIWEQAVNPDPDTYNPFGHRVAIGRAHEEEASVTIAHEYAHHVQKKKWGSKSFDIRYSSFFEGFCRGVERNTAKKRYEEHNNERALKDHFTRHIPEIKVVYNWMCECLGKYPDRKAMQYVPYGHTRGKWLWKAPCNHALGNAALYLYESTQGTRIYKDILKGDFAFKPL